MSSKLIFTVSSVKVCEQVVEALRLGGVEDLVVNVEQSNHENLQVKLLDQFPGIEFEGVLDPAPLVV